jgi:hypothetical protein
VLLLIKIAKKVTAAVTVLMVLISIVFSPTVFASKVEYETSETSIQEAETLKDNLLTGQPIKTAKNTDTPVRPVVPEPNKPEPLQINGNWHYNIVEKKSYWKLSWDRISRAREYRIYRGEERDGEYTLIAKISDKSETAFIDDTLSYTKEYYYYVTFLYSNERETEPSNIVVVDYDSDTDKDGLSDILEYQLGTDVNNPDTDGDGLPDAYEVYVTATDPTLKDTDGNGIPDGEEDRDEDGLTNLQELKYGTHPRVADTDGDGWLDGYEIIRGTVPLNPDTDGDGVEDGLEEAFNFDPLNPDTDGNGILDGDEIVEHTTTAGSYDKDPYLSPSVKIKSSAKEASSTNIVNVEGTSWFLSRDIPGYLGAPYDFSTDIEFDEAVMTFTYNPSLVTDGFRPEIFYYNEEEQRLERLPNQVHNVKDRAVTAVVDHFSTYLLLNGMRWDEAWEKEIKPPAVGDDGKAKNIEVVFSIDSSGSMAWEDPDNLRKVAAKSFVDKLREEDRAAVVDFDSTAKLLVSLTTDKTAVKYAIDMIDSVGGTNLYAGVVRAVDEIVKNGTAGALRFVIFLTDGDGTWNDSAIKYANDNKVTIYTIGLGNGVRRDLLERIATQTGGRYYFASQAQELEKIFEETAGETIDYTKDSDGDGLPDYLEKNGMRLGNGVWVKTDYLNPDTDGDSLLDGEEVLRHYIPYNGGYFYTVSNPLEKDSDGDGLADNEEEPVRRMVYDFTHRFATIMSNMSYTNLEKELKNNKEGVLITDIASSKFNSNFSHKLAHPHELTGWKLIKAEDSHFYDTGFGAMALKRGKMVVLVYRGTDGLKLSAMNDWINNAGILLFGNNLMVDQSKFFAADVILKNPNAEMYVTGHSLGGFLTQATSYSIMKNDLGSYTFSFRKLKKILENQDYFKKAITFNSAFFFPPSNLISLFTRAVPYSELKSSKYDNLVYNYAIEGDPLLKAQRTLGGYRLGRLRVFETSYDSPDGPHGIDNFYSIAKEMRESDK